MIEDQISVLDNKEYGLICEADYCEHIMKEGESLYDVSLEHYGAGEYAEFLIILNALRDIDDIKAGQGLIVPLNLKDLLEIISSKFPMLNSGIVLASGAILTLK